MGRTSGWQTKAKARIGTVYAVCEEENSVLQSGSRGRNGVNSKLNPVVIYAVIDDRVNLFRK